MTETPLQAEDVKRLSHSDAYPLSSVFVDFDNDGETEHLAKFEFSSGAGAGCDNSYYMLLENGTLVTEGPKAALLEQLQANFSFTADAGYPRSCGGNSVHWVRFGTETQKTDFPRYYLEYRGSPYIRPLYFDPENLWRVSAVNNGQVTVACSGRTYIETRLVQYDTPYGD